MNDDQCEIKRAMLVLSDGELENIAWHLRENTPVCCGSRACFYADGYGGGCPACLAGTRVVPRDNGLASEIGALRFRRMARVLGYYDALFRLNQTEVREGMQAACDERGVTP